MSDTLFKKRHDLRVYMEDHEFEQLKELAAEMNLSVSGYARMLIKKHLKEADRGDAPEIIPLTGSRAPKRSKKVASSD